MAWMHVQVTARRIIDAAAAAVPIFLALQDRLKQKKKMINRPKKKKKDPVLPRIRNMTWGLLDRFAAGFRQVQQPGWRWRQDVEI